MMTVSATPHGSGRSARGRRNLVPTVVERLRERVYGGAPHARLGSLPQLASDLGVGIVTIQQAARVLEHEGLLEVRRGPGGGYYGRRPDEAALERVLSAYMRAHPSCFDEALDITSLLFIELCGAAARCTDGELRADLGRLSGEVEACVGGEDIAAVETRLQDLLFRMVERPIFELLTRVTLRFAATEGAPRLYQEADVVRRWAQGRRRIIAAIGAGDEALARFEADRSNRQPILAALAPARDAARRLP